MKRGVEREKFGLSMGKKLGRGKKEKKGRKKRREIH
jgi:hypothetical protein